jgi:hypothetical protein
VRGSEQALAAARPPHPLARQVESLKGALIEPYWSLNRALIEP